ncbi:MAG: H-NS histone family protein [Hyphomicrobiaceae bacterium TMED74]|nr:histidine biosynthesis protein [Filomicrobium sp.]RPG40797.1 MAG: H-NS histone family protein [Hyphomicrobiaceae bacterium TMED74]
MRPINVDKMALKDLIDLELKVKKAIVTARERERLQIKSQVEELIEEAGFSIDEIFARGRGAMKGRTVAPKYANPDDKSETWTGRGRMPKWLVAKLKKGAKIEQFAI